MKYLISGPLPGCTHVSLDKVLLWFSILLIHLLDNLFPQDNPSENLRVLLHASNSLYFAM